jgi:hypothetical protein
MPSGQEPAREAAMMYEEDAFAIRRYDHSGTSDVSGSELLAGVRIPCDADQRSEVMAIAIPN